VIVRDEGTATEEPQNPIQNPAHSSAIAKALAFSQFATLDARPRRLRLHAKKIRGSMARSRI